MRYFFALQPDEASVGRLRGLAEALQVGGGAVCVAPENFHVTLCFVGSLPESQFVSLQRIGKEQRKRQGIVAFGSLEYWHRSQVVVASGIRVSPRIEELSADLADACSPYRMPLEHERWRAHVTLMKKVTQLPVLQPMIEVQWCAKAFCLMRSEPGVTASIYTVVDSWPLLDEL